MKFDKKIIIVIAMVLLVFTTMVTYAFFSLGITGEGKDNVVEAGILSLHFEDGPEYHLIMHILEKV